VTPSPRRQGIQQTLGRKESVEDVAVSDPQAWRVLRERDLRVIVDPVFYRIGQLFLQGQAESGARSDDYWPRWAAAGYRVGDPHEPTIDLGPLVSGEALAGLTGYIKRGIDDGAELLTGGPGRPAGTERGYFVAPTVFAGVDPGRASAREEIFGPVLSIIGYDSEDHAVSIANDTIYGLHGSVWSRTDDHAKAVARRVRTGVIDINGGTFNVLAPFGGFKQSGFGQECGVEGLDGFHEVKSMQEPADGRAEATSPRIREVCVSAS
jgi:aldehyde dehydrogenase (NAD+)